MNSGYHTLIEDVTKLLKFHVVLEDEAPNLRWIIVECCKLHSVKAKIAVFLY